MPSTGVADDTTDDIADETVDEISEDTADDTSDDDDYVTLVKSFIDAGTCTSTLANTNCGDSATSYYNEFEYNGQRVVIASGIPDHIAETDAVKQNPNTRCETWTYMAVPIDPTKVSFFSLKDSRLRFIFRLIPLTLLIWVLLP
jgi:hypothetical protein